MNDFGKAPIKGEGTTISYDKGMEPSNKPLIETEWIEFSLPAHLEEECRKMIADWLKMKGVIYE